MLCFAIFIGVSQDMQQGFELLNSGSFQEASVFFEEVLDQYPQNKTANICYGRAIGLNGESSKAIVLFLDLKKRHPSDTEVDLNLAEAYMWEKRYQEAEEIYSKIVQQDPNNFTANLGLANAYSSLNRSVIAFQHIQQALTIEPENQSARISKKYILLALAEKSKITHKYSKALDLLNEIKEMFPMDREAMLNEAICYLWKDDPKAASKIYEQLLIEEIDPFEAQMGLSYTSTLMGKKQKALEHADKALSLTDPDSNPNQYRRASLNKINCLAIRKDFDEAEVSLNSYLEKSDDNRSFRISQARMSLWNFEVNESLKLFEQLNEEYPNDFEILMALAETHKTLKNYKKSIQYIDQALEIIPNQADALRMKEQVKAQYAPGIFANGFRSQDVASNQNTGLDANFVFGSDELIRSNLHFQLNTLSNPETQQNASQYLMKYEASHDINYRLNIHGGIQASLATDNNEFKEENILLNTGLRYKLNKNSNVAYEFLQEQFNFNVELLKSGIRMDHHKIVFNQSNQHGTGFFAQYIHSTQTDENKRNLFSASLYQHLLRRPIIQVGLNYTSLQFKFEVPELYFSPSQYNAYEAFFKVNNFDLHRSKFLYHAFVAPGLQQVNRGNLEASLRIEADIGYRLLNDNKILLYYRYSSLDQTTSVGFTWSAIGIKTTVLF